MYLITQHEFLKRKPGFKFLNPPWLKNGAAPLHAETSFMKQYKDGILHIPFD